MGFGIFSRTRRNDALFRAGQFGLKRVGDRFRDSLSTAKMSVSLRSYVSAQRCASVSALISCTFTRTWSFGFLHAAFEDIRDAELSARSRANFPARS